MVRILNTHKVKNKWLAYSLLGLLIVVILQWGLHLSPWITFSTIVVLIFATGYLLSNSPKETTKSNSVKRDESRTNARSIGLKLQGSGQLYLAFEKFKQCAHNHDTANLLYNLSIDFQIKGEPDNAKRVLQHIAEFAPSFKDIKERLQFFESELDQNINREDQNLVEKATLSADASPETKQCESSVKEESADSKTVSIYADRSDIEGEISDFPLLYGSRYKVVKLLGEGTTGAVFKGKDIAADKDIAIKVLNLTAELDANQLDEYKFRFHREIDTAGNLDHPNIVKIYDNGESDGFAYIVMEYVNGINLRNYARVDNLLHPKTLLKLIAQCADALAYAHKQNVIHRDIKPANILYNQSGDYIKLTDFGIAKIPDSTRTRAGSILGTPLYMSPEQLAGEKLDARSDLYSLGVTLYQLLTGSPPFRPKTMAELLRSITKERHKDIAEINPDTPSCIAWTVNKALEKDPDKRFQSAASMANKLRECQMMLDN